MITEVEIGKNYALYLLPLYGGTKQNVSVIGMTNIDNVALNEDEYNIFETYFQPLGLGLTSYYTAIQEKTEIYICKPITSLEPFTLGDEKVFIPKSLIDISESSEYISAYNFNFQIYPLIKRFDSDTARDEFSQEIVNKVLHKLKELIDFNILDETTIDISYDTVYLTKETIDNMENRSRTLWDNYNKRKRDLRQGEKLLEDQYNSTINRMEESIKANNEATQKMNDKIVVLEKSIEDYKEATRKLLDHKD